MLSVIKDNIKDYFKKNFKLLIFILIFAIVCSIYNLNLQTINMFFKRGIILEYSILPQNKIDKEQMENRLAKLGVKYSFIETPQNLSYSAYDPDGDLIQSTLLVGLAILPDKTKINLINSISDYVFDASPNSKLIDVRKMNDYYSKSYSAFLRFLGLVLSSFCIWIILIYLLSDGKKFMKNSRETFKNFLTQKKNAFLNFVKNTKEKGFGYFIKCLLFDDNNKEDEEINFTKEIITTIVFVVICVILIRYFIGELRWIPSSSMYPTILEHDRVFVEKLDYPKKEIKRGDILVFYPPQSILSNSPLAIFSRLSGIFCKDIAYIKRTIGLPGEKFEIKYDEAKNEYRVYINDVALNEPYISSRQNWTSCDSEEVNCGPFIIPKNNYFMMGDNRGNSKDSRFWGFLDKDRVIGRANFMFFPIRRINLLKDKYLLLNKQKYGASTIQYNYIINRY